MTKQTSIKVPMDLYERALEWCREHDRSFGKLVAYALAQYLDSQKTDQGQSMVGEADIYS